MDRALRSLPRIGATRGFTARVVAEARERGEPRPVGGGGRHRLGGFGLAAAGALVGLLAAGLALRSRSAAELEPRPTHLTGRVAVLRTEVRDLESEIRDLRRSLESESAPLLLASDHGVDLVVDVDRLAALARSGPPSPQAQYADEETRHVPPR